MLIGKTTLLPVLAALVLLGALVPEAEGLGYFGKNRKVNMKEAIQRANDPKTTKFDIKDSKHLDFVEGMYVKEKENEFALRYKKEKEKKEAQRHAKENKSSRWPWSRKDRSEEKAKPVVSEKELAVVAMMSLAHHHIFSVGRLVTMIHQFEKHTDLLGEFIRERETECTALIIKKKDFLLPETTYYADESFCLGTRLRKALIVPRGTEPPSHTVAAVRMILLGEAKITHAIAKDIRIDTVRILKTGFGYYLRQAQFIGKMNAMNDDSKKVLRKIYGFRKPLMFKMKLQGNEKDFQITNPNKPYQMTDLQNNYYATVIHEDMPSATKTD